MKSDFLLAFNQICNDRKLSREVVLEALQMALVSAYRRGASTSVNQNVTAKIDLETGKTHIFVEKTVVDNVASSDLEISVAEARRIQPEASLGDPVNVDDTPKNFGRIAAQSAKQIILQRIREAEREALFTRYVQQEGEIVHGAVHSVTPQAVVLHIDGAEAVLPRSQQVPGERHTLHQRLRAYVLEVKKSSRGPQIIVSRSHKNMLRRLLELEVPEVFNGTVEIKAIAREAGSRSKVAVVARQAGIDPVGACVGMRGVRIQSIVNELGGEKIDVIEWDADPAKFIAKALSPARVLTAGLQEGPVEGRTASVVVPDEQLSLAIGRAGQNARLAAKLTGWRIDIRSVTEAATEALNLVNEDDRLLPALGSVAELLPSVANALHQHERDRLPFNGEELLVMRQVIEGVHGYYASIRNAAKEQARAEEEARRAAIEVADEERRSAIQAAYALIPPQAYEILLSEIGLSVRVLNHLHNSQLESVGDVLKCMAEGDEGLLKLDGIGPRSLAEVRKCIEALALPENKPDELAEGSESGSVMPAEAGIPTPLSEAAVGAEESPAPSQEEVPELAPLVSETPGVEIPPGVAPEVSVTETVSAEMQAAVEEETEEEIETAGRAQEAETVELPLVDVEEVLLGEDESLDTAKRDRERRRELVFDEDAGRVIARRKHKRGSDVEDWDELL